MASTSQTARPDHVSRRPRPHGPTRALAGTIALLLLGGVVACGSPTRPGQAADDDRRPSGSAPAAPDGLRASLITADALPAGFRDSTGVAPGYRLTLCGVDLEPTPASDHVATRFAVSEIGPFVEQRVRRYPDDSQQRVLTAMAAALRTCTTTAAEDPSRPGQRTTFVITPLDVGRFADQSVAWHQEPTSGPHVPTDVVLMRRGRTIALVTSYTFGRSTDPAAIRAAAAAAATRLADEDGQQQ